jgi:C4-dicarboxylate-specific signal transduction histidine kinase
MELAHANRVATIGHLTASIAHEVNQPIAGTVTNAEAALRWLGRDPPDLGEIGKALRRIVRDGNRAADVITRIRRMITKGIPQGDFLDVNRGIREVIELTRSEAHKNGVSVRTNLADGLPVIRGDRIQLQQVMLNLIINAVEAMRDITEGTRELLISTETAAPDAVLVTVSDSGPGLTPAGLDRLFEPFYTTKPGGLGLGLSICRSIIEAHGGRLWASANALGGISFHFTLPGGADTASNRRV